jgi:hypothetical protein
MVMQGVRIGPFSTLLTVRTVCRFRYNGSILHVRQGPWISGGHRYDLPAVKAVAALVGVAEGGRFAQHGTIGGAATSARIVSRHAHADMVYAHAVW